MTPLQVYASALVFSPERSVVRQIFQHEAPAWIIGMPAMEPTWNACLQTLMGHNTSGCSVAFSADGRFLASASTGGFARIWDVASGSCFSTIRVCPAYADKSDSGRRKAGGTVAFSAHGCWLAYGSPDGTVNILDLLAMGRLHTMKGHTEGVGSVAFSRDSSKIASASFDYTARIWDAKKGICLHTLRQGHINSVMSVAFSADDWLAAAFHDGTVMIWDAAKGECVKILRDHGQGPRSVAFSPDGRRLVSAGPTNVHIWNVGTGDRLLKLDNDDDERYFSVAFSANGRLIAIGSTDSIKLWDADNGALTHTLRGPDKFSRSVAFSPDSKRLASASNDWIVRIWDIPTMQAYTFEANRDREVDPVYFSVDGRMFATAPYSDSKIHIWSTSTGNCLQTFGHERLGVITDVNFSTDNLRLASASTLGSIKIWNTETGCCVQSIDKSHDRVALIENGKKLASAWSGLIEIRDVATGNCLHTLGNRNKGYMYKSFVKVSTGGQWLAYSVDGKTIRLWNTVNGVDVLPLEDHADDIRSIAFSEDERRFASASSGALKIWDVETGTCVKTVTTNFHHWDPCLSFDTNHQTRLHTRFGFLDLDVLPERTPPGEEATKKVCYRGYGIDISIQETWILRDGEKVLRIPPDYVSKFDVFASFMDGPVFVWVSHLGRVFRLRVSNLEYDA